jgi:hypothetical protein
MVPTVNTPKSADVYAEGIKALIGALGFDGATAFLQQSAGTPGRDFAKWLSEQPERPFDDIVADVMKTQDEIKRGIIDIAGCPIK